MSCLDLAHTNLFRRKTHMNAERELQSYFRLNIPFVRARHPFLRTAVIYVPALKKDANRFCER